MSEIPARLRAARGYAGLAQHELATAIGVSEQTYKQTELGNRVAPRGQLLHIAEVCQVPMAFMDYGWEAVPGWSTPEEDGGRGAGAELAQLEADEEVGLGQFEASGVRSEEPPLEGEDR